MHPFRDDRRSKSIEEREEEYQRVRERIFAHDVSSCFNCLLSMVLPSAERFLVSQTESWQGVQRLGPRRESQSRKHKCFQERTWFRDVGDRPRAGVCPPGHDLQKQRVVVGISRRGRQSMQKGLPVLETHLHPY